MPDCHATQGRLGRYFDGELLPAECHLVEEHLSQCRRCRAALQGIREISGMFSDGIRTPPVPSGLPQRIMENARKQVPGAPPALSFVWFWKDWSFSMRFAAAGVAAAACYIGIAIGSASLPANRRAGDDMQWVGLSSRGPIVSAYAGSAK